MDFSVVCITIDHRDNAHLRCSGTIETMEGMVKGQFPEQVKRGLFEARRDNTTAGLIALEKYAENTENPEILCWYGYSVAKERKAFSRGIDLCLKALYHDSRCSDAYLCMGKIYLLAGRKNSALKAFNRGLTIEQNPALLKELRRFGTRKRPVFPFFNRDNPLNVYTGRLLSRLRIR